MKYARKLSVAIITATLALSAFAADKPKALVDAEAKNQLKVLKGFDGPSGLAGWVVSPAAGPGKAMIMYSTADGKTMITGNPVVLIDESGRNLTAEYEAFLPKPDYTAIYGDLQKVKTINTGKQGKNPVFVYLDPNCIYCNFAYRALEPYIKAGADIRWVPVGFLRADSPNKAAAIMTAKNPAAALADHEARYKDGGIKPVESVSEDISKQLAANAALMQKAEISGTPAIFYKDKAGKVQFVGGMPKLSMLPEITGIAEQKVDDPELARFK